MLTERQKEAQRRYRAKHLERLRESQKVRAAKWRAANPEGQRAAESLSAVTRLRRLEKAAGRPRPGHCEVCGELHRWICFDHDHSTGKFRGWICDRCNKVLGHVYDRPSVLRLLADYLERHHGKKPSN